MTLAGQQRPPGPPARLHLGPERLPRVAERVEFEHQQSVLVLHRAQPRADAAQEVGRAQLGLGREASVAALAEEVGGGGGNVRFALACNAGMSS